MADGLLGRPTPPRRNLLDQAIDEYPVLGRMGLQYKDAPRNDRGFMEFWPAGEPGSPDYQRPAEFDINRSGVEMYRPDKSRPIDIMGEASSHLMKDSDPATAYYYQMFRGSLTDQQKATLQDQYTYAQKNEGEKRPYEDWHEQSGLPAMFRGYMFQQWPKDFNDKIYTPEQKQNFDDLLGSYKAKR